MTGRKYEQMGGYRYGFNRKEKDRDITSDDYDFGARIYDGRIGRWLSIDPFSNAYSWISGYSFGANNPINITDADGGILRDKNGKIIVTPTDNYYSRNRDFTTKEGEKYKITATYREVIIYTDKGTPISALKMISSQVEKIVDGEPTTVKTSPIDASQNCHGWTFADGKLVVVDGSNKSDAINTIIVEDGYEPSEQKDADIYVHGYSNIIHSGKFKKNRTVTSDHDLLKPGNTTFKKEKSDYGNARFLKRKKAGDKRISVENGDTETYPGINLVSKEEAEKLRKKEKLNSSNTPVGSLNNTDFKKLE